MHEDNFTVMVQWHTHCELERGFHLTFGTLHTIMEIFKLDHLMNGS